MRLQTICSFIAIALFTILSLQEAWAGYPTRAFTATYQNSGITRGIMKMMSDGKGKMRIENNLGGGQGTVVSITDYPARTMTTVLEAQKMVMKTTMPPDTNYEVDENMMKKYKATSLGSKVVLGHPCKGWKYSQNGAETEVWVGDDINYTVRSITITKQGTQQMDLKDFSNAAPPASMFVVPAGYKEMNIGR